MSRSREKKTVHFSAPLLFSITFGETRKKVRYKNWRHDVLPSSASSLSNGGRRDARPSIKHKALITQSINARCSRGCSFLHIFFLHFSPVQNHNETLRCFRWKWVGEGAQKKSESWEREKTEQSLIHAGGRWKNPWREKRKVLFFTRKVEFSREKMSAKKNVGGKKHHHFII